MLPESCYVVFRFDSCKSEPASGDFAWLGIMLHLLSCLCCWLALQKYVCLHAERDPLHQGLIVERAKLKPRGYQLDLASRLGKTQVVTNSTPLNQQVAAVVIFACHLCHVLCHHT